MAKEMPLPSRMEQGEEIAEREDLAERYLRADLHDRLCLWLQFREAREELNLLEGEGEPEGLPAKNAGCLNQRLGLKGL